MQDEPKTGHTDDDN